MLSHVLSDHQKASVSFTLCMVIALIVAVAIGGRFSGAHGEYRGNGQKEQDEGDSKQPKSTPDDFMKTKDEGWR